SPMPVEDLDLVAGDPPVPITVWRTTRSDADGPGVVGRRLAARIVSAYSRPGDPVVDLTDERQIGWSHRCSDRREGRPQGCFRRPARTVRAPLLRRRKLIQRSLHGSIACNDLGRADRHRDKIII